ncbi:type II toxin-antitoxin system RelE/ParE family toxin [Frigidibacter oleivorans]|uniref:type II toxin-antitoxin system RelE/ParE family toxin n=1 Tax=Frigidibacter oleivorans TaxID=2487129 RepID=UPI00197A8C08|nr:type II toxin-antitoxin system RelE/ParE family toxin [Frigidibacter oleivorans]
MPERRLVWVADARKRLLEFPKPVRVQVGYALGEAQLGRKAASAKPMTGLGAGVMEIVADHDGDTFRAVYAVKLGDDLYVLHAFQKKSRTGIATPKHEIDVIKTRLKRLNAQLGMS